jgi:hypothetical protein
VLASDDEDTLALATNLVVDSSVEQKEDAIDSDVAIVGFPSLLVQRVLTTQLGDEEETKVQRNNLFYMVFIVQERCVLTIIDTGSYNNLVSSDLVRKLGFPTHELCHSYHIQWLNNSGKAKVTHSARIHFSVGSYTDYADFDVAPMEACSILLGRPWEYEKDVAHDGRTNTYTFMHKNRNITLLPLSPTVVRKYFTELAEDKKKQHDVTESSANQHDGIKLKRGAFIATTSTTIKCCENYDAPCYTMLSQDVRLLDATMCCMHFAVTNLL